MPSLKLKKIAIRTESSKKTKSEPIRAAQKSMRKKIDRPQSGVIPWLRTPEGELRIMLISAAGGGPWILPKGNLEPDMTPCESAAKEAFEEAGIRGECAAEPAGEFTFSKGPGAVIRAKLYPLHITEILDEWEESGKRRRRLFLRDRAYLALRDPGMAEIVRTFVPPEDR